MPTEDSFETALADLERQVDASAKVVMSALKEVKKAKVAAASGSIKDLHMSLEAAKGLGEQVQASLADLQLSWTFDAQQYFASGGFIDELLAKAQSEGVSAFAVDEKILCYPTIVQIASAETTVFIDKARVRNVRPSVLVRLLKSIQTRPPKFKADAFLESLSDAYDLVRAKRAAPDGSVERLIDVYSVLTLLPGSNRDYTKPEFARDIYLLDQSGIVTTKNGRTLTLPASALTRGSGLLSTVSRTGQEKIYVGIRVARDE